MLPVNLYMQDSVQLPPAGDLPQRMEGTVLIHTVGYCDDSHCRGTVLIHTVGYCDDSHCRGTVLIHTVEVLC